MWWKRKQSRELSGSVSFRGGLPPRAEDFSHLEELGIELTLDAASPEQHWQLGLRHPQIAGATIACRRHAEPFPELLVRHDARLSDGEKARALLPHCVVDVRLEVTGENVLAQRKQLLHLLRAALGEDGLVALDHQSQAFWSMEALDLELMHEADVDILSLFTTHIVSNPSGKAYWLHTHGLKDLGFVELDVIEPPRHMAQAWDVVRALAFSIVEGKLEAGGAAASVARSATGARLVPSAELVASAGDRYPDWRDALDPEHIAGHAVVCDEARRGFWAFFGRRPTPWSVLAGEIRDDLVLHFSDAASELSSARARATWGVLPTLQSELDSLGCVTLAKLKFTGPQGGEHLWFEVHDILPDSLVATLTNEPFQDIGIKAGERGTHGLERLSDWMLLTPAGMLSPRDMTALRTVRENRDAIERYVAAGRAET